MAAEHLTPLVTDRGIKYMNQVAADRGIESVQVYESSAASEPKVWLAVNGGEVIMALSAENAWMLAEQLMFLVTNHYQGDSRPPAAERFADLVSTTPVASL